MKKLLLPLLILFSIWSFADAQNTVSRSGRWLYKDGVPVYLIGYDAQHLFNFVQYTEQQAKNKMDEYAGWGITGFRVWINYLNKLPTNAVQETDRSIYPFYYNSSTRKFDLNVWNEAFFTRYKNLITHAKSKGLIIEICILAEYPEVKGTLIGWVQADKPHMWTYSTDPAYYGNSNDDRWPNVSGDLYPEFYIQTHKSGTLFAKQKELVAKVITEFKPIGNVFFQIHNEWPPHWADSGKGTQTCTGANAACSPYCLKCTTTAVDELHAWQEDMADYFKSLGAITSAHAHSFGGKNLQGIQYWKARPSIDVLTFHPYFTSTDDSLSNIPSAVTSFFSSLQNSGKVLLIDETDNFFNKPAGDPNYKPDLITQEMWGSFVNGVYYFIYGSYSFGMNPEEGKRLKVVNEISKLVDWPNMTYNQKAVVKGTGVGPKREAMAKIGEQYVVYYTGTPNTNPTIVNLPAGTYNCKWYGTTSWNANGLYSNTVTSTGGNVKIAAPPSGTWTGTDGVVLVIKK